MGFGYKTKRFCFGKKFSLVAHQWQTLEVFSSGFWSVKQKGFLFFKKGSLDEKSMMTLIFTLGICLCEGVGEDSRYVHDESHTIHGIVGHGALKACNLYCFMKTIFYI